ncbi:MAG: VWA domain-containing protein [Epsilonproteobacteria bacterium]|nr:MAG: VWA domain-containing protein [Campylobacterota bacterium]
MTFLHPEFIYFMLPPVLVLFYFLLTQHEQHLQFFSDEVLSKLRVQTNMMTLKARNGLFLLMFVMLILALAQPVIEDGKVKIQAKSADIMIALDISDSMLAADLYPNRIEHAKKKIMTLLERAKQERIGVMAFAKDAYLVSPLSFDHRAVRFLVKQMQPSHITEKGTDFIQLLNTASRMLQEHDQKYLLVLTDGGDESDFTDAIAFAKEEGIKVFVLGIGTERGAPIKRKDGGFITYKGETVITHLNHAVAKLATQTGGAYIESVLSDEDMDAMLKEISAKTDKRSLAEEEITRYIPLFQYPLGMAMLLLLIATSSMSRRKQVDLPMMLASVIFLLQTTTSEAALFDFQLLEDAKTSYVSEEFNQSARLYADYASRHRTEEAYYNQANALYKAGQFENAAKLFEKIHTPDKQLQAKALHNAGNAYARQGTKGHYQKALEAYEKSLKIHEDTQTRENLEMVKERLKEQEQKEEKNDQNEQDEKNKDQNKDQKNQDKQKSDKEEESKDSDQKNQESSDDKNQDSKEQKSDKKGGDKNGPQDDKDAEKKKQEKTKSDKALDKKRDEQAEEAQQDQVESMMSDMEAKKWQQRLNEDTPGHLYKLQPMKEGRKRDENEKPW